MCVICEIVDMYFLELRRLLILLLSFKLLINAWLRL